MTLLVVPPPTRPVTVVPRPPWREWFCNETDPLHHSAINHKASYRRLWTKESPLRFAWVYLPDHLQLRGEGPPKITFNEMHLGLSIAAKQWMQPKRWREIWVAPRGIGKSSWAFLILPLWAIAHGHRSYFMAFSYDDGMAHDQLANLRLELAENELLLHDFPELRPAKARGAQNTGRTVVASGGTIAAMGMQGNMLGKKSRWHRPDLIVCDDIEKLEVLMTADEKKRIITTLTSGVLQMGTDHTAVGVFGTPTSYGSVIDDAARHARGELHADWIANNGFTARVFPGIQVDPATGEERSIWPERWPLTDTHFGKELRKTVDNQIPREFADNYLLNPSPLGDGTGGGLFREELIQYRRSDQLGGVFEHAMYIDTAPTSHRGSDNNAIVIVGRHPARRYAVIEYVWAGQVGPTKLREIIHSLARRNPTLKTVIAEVVHGQDLWRETIDSDEHPLPPGVTYRAERYLRGDKVARVRRVLDLYETGKVFHAKKFMELEREMILFPNPRIKDDRVDALTGALRWAFER